jgi:hypothetical protein
VLYARRQQSLELAAPLGGLVVRAVSARQSPRPCDAAFEGPAPDLRAGRNEAYWQDPLGARRGEGGEVRAWKPIQVRMDVC